MKNTLIDVHNNLMEQMERLMDAESPEELEKEISRSKAVADISKVIVDNSKTMLDATKLSLEYNLSLNNTILSIDLKDNK